MFYCTCRTPSIDIPRKRTVRRTHICPQSFKKVVINGRLPCQMLSCQAMVFVFPIYFAAACTFVILSPPIFLLCHTLIPCPVISGVRAFASPDNIFSCTKKKRGLHRSFDIALLFITEVPRWCVCVADSGLQFQPSFKSFILLLNDERVLVFDCCDMRDAVFGHKARI